MACGWMGLRIGIGCFESKFRFGNQLSAYHPNSHLNSPYAVGLLDNKTQTLVKSLGSWEYPHACAISTLE